MRLGPPAPQAHLSHINTSTCCHRNSQTPKMSGSRYNPPCAPVSSSGSARLFLHATRAVYQGSRLAIKVDRKTRHSWSPEQVLPFRAKLANSLFSEWSNVPLSVSLTPDQSTEFHASSWKSPLYYQGLFIYAMCALIS